MREFELLEYLLRSRARSSRERRSRAKSGRSAARTPTLDNVIDVHIARLGKKIDAGPAVKLIHTVRGVGFMVSGGGGMNRWRSSARRSPRLTLWYVAAMVIVLAVYAVGVFGFVSRSVSDALDSRLRSDFTWAAEMWDQRPDGTLTWFDADAARLGRGQPVAAGLVAPRRAPLPDGGRAAKSSAGRARPWPRSRQMADRLGVDDGGPTFRVLSRTATVGGKPVVIQVARSEARCATSCMS